MVPVAALALSLGLNSCTKDLDVEPIDPSKNTTVDAEKLLNKCYAEFTLEGYGPGSSELDLGDSGLSVLYRLMWNANELTTDEAICGWTDKGVADFDYNTYTSTNDCLYGLWWRLCLGVSLCNQYIQECSDYNPQMTAEAHFLRDLYYYYLLDNYGNPAYTEEVSSDNPVQISSAELFSKIVADLEANMGNMLPPSVRKKGEANYARADQSAAWMLLARLYLNAEKYTGTPNWAKAKEYAAKVINESGRTIWMGDNATTHKSANGSYSAYQMLFMADNDVSGAYNESIFAFATEGATTASWGSSTFLFASTWDGNMMSIYPGTTDQKWGGNRTRKDLIEKFIDINEFDALADWKTETIVEAAGDDRALFFGDNADGSGGIKDRKYTNDVLSEFTTGIATTKYRSNRSDEGATTDTKFLDNDIMLFRRYLSHTLKGEADTYFIYMRMSTEEAIVITLSTPQTMTSSIESHAWHQREVYLVVSIENLSNRFHDMKSTFLQVGTRGIATQFHGLVTSHLGQHDLDTLPHQLVNQRTDIHLIGQGPVGHDGLMADG